MCLLHLVRAGCHWEMCLSLTRKLGMTAEETRDCAMDLFDQLKSNRLSADAARIALEYLDDVDEAVLLYCEARYPAEHPDKLSFC